MLSKLIDEYDTKIVTYFGNFCEVRSLDFFLSWAKATEKPIVGKLLKKLFVWFCGYYSGFVIPKDGSLTNGSVIMPYENILELAKRAKLGRLWPCSCKSYRNPEDKLMPRDTCMVFEIAQSLDDIANNDVLPEGWVNSEVIINKLKECEEYGLVHQIMCVSNPLGRKMYVLCNCDSNSCVPNYIKLRYNIPFVRSSGFVCKIENSQKCDGCNKCVERCIYKACSFENNIPVIDEEKCLGCGLCISTCKSGIRKMYRKPREKFHYITKKYVDNNCAQTMKTRLKGEYPKML